MAGALSLKHEQIAEFSKKFFGTFHVYNQIDSADRPWFLSAQTMRIIANLHVDIKCENIRITQDEEGGEYAD